MSIEKQNFINDMKKNIYFLLLSGLLFSTGMLTWTSCTDEWDEHYKGGAEDLSSYPTLLERLKDQSDPDVRQGRFEQFVRVLEATGYDQQLSSPALLTVFAPMDMTQKDADKWIERYNYEKDYVQDAYNTALTQFVGNHVSLYGHNFVKLSPDEKTDTVSMINGKYMRVHSDAGSSEWTVGVNGGTGIDAAHGVITEKKLCNNGYLYKITGGALPCYLNLKEAIDTLPDITRFTAYKHKYDDYELDEEKSVPGEIIDGNQVYIDSILIYENTELAGQYDAYFHREDSSYLFLLPNDELWDKLYTKYVKYFNYQPTGDDEDSQRDADALKDTWTNRAIMYGRIFNMNSANNEHPEDSLCSSKQYGKYQYRPYGFPYGHYTAIYNGELIDVDEDYRTYVWRKPLADGGILDGLEKQTCSNGYIYVDTNDDDVLVNNEEDNLWYKTWFASQAAYADRLTNYYPKTFVMNGSTVVDGGERFDVKERSVNSKMRWIVCRKRADGEPFLPNKIYDRDFYLDTIGWKIYHVDGNSYMRVMAKGSTDKVMKNKNVTDEETRVFYDYTLGTNIMSNVYYNAYVVTMPSDVENGAVSKAQGLAFKVIEDYEHDERSEEAKYVPYNKGASDSYYPSDYNEFQEIYVGDGQETAILKCKLPKDGFVWTGGNPVKDPDDGHWMVDATATSSVQQFYPYEDGRDDYGMASDEFYVESTKLRNKVYVPKTRDVDVVQIMRARTTEYATIHQDNASPTWVLRIYNAMRECQATLNMGAYVDKEGVYKTINQDIFNPLTGSLRISHVILKPFRTKEEAEHYSIKDLMEEYHIATTFQYE